MSEGTWYRTGLVSLANGSDLVAGVGTEFIANVLPGAIFFAPEGLYEVERAVSDTQLKLVEPYAGPTVAGAEFAIAPTQGAVVQATKQLQAFLSELGPLKQAWETGELDPKGLATKGVKNTVEELPAVGNTPGDAWLVDGVLYMWTGSVWSNQGSTVKTPELEALRDAAVAAKNTSEDIAATFGDVAGAVGAATAKADAAAASAGNAASREAGALAAKTAAETASAIALARGRTYANAAAGVNPAGTPVGVGVNEYFTVPSATALNSLDLYQNVAGAAVLQPGKSIPSADSTLLYRGTSDVGDLNYSSFNSMVKPGFYWNTRQAAQTPYGTVATTGSIKVERVGPDQAVQVFYKDGLSVEAWARTFTISTSTFGAWKRVMGYGQLAANMVGATSFYRGTTLDAVADPAWGLNISNFNALVNEGFYWNPSRVCSNTPYGTIAAVGGVSVRVVGPDQAIQTFYKDGDIAEVWIRSFVISTASFSAWRRQILFGPLGASAFGSTTLYRGSTDTVATDPTWGLNISNFNQMVSAGYYTNPSRACSNTPYGVSVAIGTIKVEHVSPDLAIQTYCKDGLLNEVWSRSFVPSTSTFAPWERQTRLTALIPADRLADNFPFREEVTVRQPNTDRSFAKCLLAGAYTFDGSQAVLDSPLGAGAVAGVVGTLIVYRRRAVHQQVFFFADNPDDFATRTFDATPSFSVWSRRTNRNAGQLLCTLGDSITATVGASTPALGYAPLMARYLGMQLTNKGYGGASLAYRPAQSTVINENCFARITAGAAMAGFNLITVAYGTNDFGASVPLGVLGSTNEEEVFGALAVGYANILAANPSARVIFIAPIYRDPETAKNQLVPALPLQAYREAVIAFCALKNLTCLQPHRSLGWNADNEATYLGDKLHPKDAGHAGLARFNAGQIGAYV